MEKPHLTFFCELDAISLEKLFAKKRLITDLAALEASVSLGILDLSPERADIVRRLNKANIPVIAWQLLPKEDGYWYNLDNVQHASARYYAFKNWTDTHKLKWTGIGIDIEPDIREMQMVFHNRWRLLPTLIRRVFNTRRLVNAHLEYQRLIDSMRKDGFRLDSYQLPLIIDERKARSTLLQRLAGLVNVQVDREIVMLYSSFLRPWGAGALWSYAHDADFVALGVTGGGVEFDGVLDKPPLSWEEFSRDLRLAWQWFDEIHIFSLEGCVQQDFLSLLKRFDWSELATPPIHQTKRVNFVRSLLQRVLWASAHPISILLVLIAIATAIRFLRSRKKMQSR